MAVTGSTALQHANINAPPASGICVFLADTILLQLQDPGNSRVPIGYLYLK